MTARTSHLHQFYQSAAKDVNVSGVEKPVARFKIHTQQYYECVSMCEFVSLYACEQRKISIIIVMSIEIDVDPLKIIRQTYRYNV